MTELDHYLKSPRIKGIKEPLQWWFDNRGTYPRLSRMARDFLTIPGESFFSFLQVQSNLILTWYLASSVAVERVFSKGRLVISHIRNRLSAQSTRSLMCLGYWSKLGFVKLEDLKAGASLPDVKDGETWSEDDWSIIA